jgi:hypothetical protein
VLAAFVPPTSIPATWVAVGGADSASGVDWVGIGVAVLVGVAVGRGKGVLVGAGLETGSGVLVGTAVEVGVGMIACSLAGVTAATALGIDVGLLMATSYPDSDQAR